MTGSDCILVAISHVGSFGSSDVFLSTAASPPPFPSSGSTFILQDQISYEYILSKTVALNSNSIDQRLAFGRKQFSPLNHIYISRLHSIQQDQLSLSDITISWDHIDGSTIIVMNYFGGALFLMCKKRLDVGPNLLLPLSCG